jgi:hypothetical protein
VQQPTTVVYANKKLENMNCIEPPNKDFGGVFLGDIVCVLKP